MFYWSNSKECTFIPRGCAFVKNEGILCYGFVCAGLGRCKLSTGTVKWFNDQKGYGFITPDSGGDDLFVHYSNITMQGFKILQEGQKVEYEPAEGRKGPEATNVKPC